jgi:hypothetical protein
MATLGEKDLLLLWEAAQDHHPLLRPVALLRAAGTDEAPERLPIGTRDRRLLALRERCFGRFYESVIDCPSCGAPVEATFETPSSSAEAATEPRTVVIDGRTIEYRLPDTTDLAAIAGSGDVRTARARLAARCVTDAAAVLPENAITALAEAMAAADPDGELTMAAGCPECAHQWEAPFDPAAYLWRELDAAAMRLFRDVDALAAAYGWSEQEILDLPRARRRAYLALVTS